MSDYRLGDLWGGVSDYRFGDLWGGVSDYRLGGLLGNLSAFRLGTWKGEAMENMSGCPLEIENLFLFHFRFPQFSEKSVGKYRLITSKKEFATNMHHPAMPRSENI